MLEGAAHHGFVFHLDIGGRIGEHLQRLNIGRVALPLLETGAGVVFRFCFPVGIKGDQALPAAGVVPLGGLNGIEQGRTGGVTHGPGRQAALFGAAQMLQQSGGIRDIEKGRQRPVGVGHLAVDRRRPERQMDPEEGRFFPFPFFGAFHQFRRQVTGFDEFQKILPRIAGGDDGLGADFRAVRGDDAFHPAVFDQYPDDFGPVQDRSAGFQESPVERRGQPVGTAANQGGVRHPVNVKRKEEPQFIR